MAYLADNSSEPGLTLESEIKLVVMTLVKVSEHLQALPCNHMMLEVAHTCFRSLLDATSRLEEVQKAKVKSQNTKAKNKQRHLSPEE